MASNSEARKRKEEAIASERLPLLDVIEALRTKHQVCDCAYCNHDECRAGCVGKYPCDVIKVLDYAKLLGEAYEHAKSMGAKMTALFAQSLNAISDCPKCRALVDDETDWTTEGYQAFSNGLNGITEERKFSDLETEVEQSEIRASATSDELPVNECREKL